MLKFKNTFLFKQAIFFGLCGIVIMLQTGCSTMHQPGSIFENITGIHHPGKFIWHDLLTGDVAAAQTFYGKLFNWTFEQQQNDRYTIIKLNNKRIGGIFYIQQESPRCHAARWISSLSVLDVDEAIDVVKANGGTVHKGPENIRDRGRVALVSDPQGAQLALLYTKNGDPDDGQIAEGSWLWHELWTNNQSDSAEFYKGLAGYSKVEKLEDYWILKNENKWRAGIRNLFNKALEQRWVPVIKVNDVKAISVLAKQIGGKVVIEPEDPDFVDQVALLADPSGALFIIQEWSGIDDFEKDELQ